LISHEQYCALSQFRSALAGFLRFSERAARGAGITPTQYLLLLHIRGAPARTWATVGQLALLLHASPHGTTALVGRCCALGLVTKRRSRNDSRCVEVHLTPRALTLVARVAGRHREELRTLREVFRVAHVS
jgi:DNA-binding MarR family transcriptional regulator